jgi:hypothetical protein
MISVGLNMLLIELVIMAAGSSLRDALRSSTPLYLAGLGLLSLLAAILLARIIGAVLDSNLGKINFVGWALIATGLVLNLISSGCPTCPSPLLAFLGIDGGLAAFPLAGLDLKLLGSVLLLVLLWTAGRHAVQGEEILPSSSMTRGNSLIQKTASFGRGVPQIMLVVAAVLAFFLLPLLPPSMKMSFESEYAAAAAASEMPADGLDLAQLYEQVNPSAGYELPVAFGAIGPALLDAGVIDLGQFEALYAASDIPLAASQRSILTEGSNERISITRENARFLLHFFWALGLANKNPILDEGPMQSQSGGDIGRFASTGGWSLGSKSAVEIYSNNALISLTPEQQGRLEQVASQVYRPCCNNPTHFPDCNHGMAMLGMLELMASQGATEQEMLQAAKYFNAFWFPQQALEVGVYFQLAEGTSFDAIDPGLAVGPQIFSGTGFGSLHAWLANAGLLNQGSGGGSSCGV